MAIEEKSIIARSGTRAELSSANQLKPGQAGFCTDEKTIVYRRRLTESTRPGELEFYSIYEADSNRVLASGSDATPGYLIEKLSFGANVALVQVETANPGDPSNGRIRIDGLGLLKADVGDSDPAEWSHLVGKLISGDNIAIDVVEDGGIRKVRITASGGSATTGPYFDFQPQNTEPANVEGRMYFDNVLKSWVGMPGGSSPSRLEYGREIWRRVINKTGATIANGTPVYISGFDAASGLPTIAKAIANSKNTCSMIVVATQDIANDTAGECTRDGLLRSFDTSAFSAGALVYVSATTAGAITTTEPLFPFFSVRIGRIMRSDATNGEILVDPDTDPNFSGGASSAFPPSVTLVATASDDGGSVTSTYGELRKAWSSTIKPNYRFGQSSQYDNSDCDPIVSVGGRLRELSIACSAAAVSTDQKAGTIYTRVQVYEIKVNSEGGPALLGTIDIPMTPVSEIATYNNLGTPNGVRGSVSCDIAVPAGTLLGFILCNQTSGAGGTMAANAYINAWRAAVLGANIY